jgi:predicted Rossmann fold nucleotide-binding protein DprA/Smf involved in DNA uptake
MKKLKKDLEALSKALNGLAQKVQKLQEQIDEDAKPTKKPKAKVAKKAPVKKVAAKKVAVKKAPAKKAAPKKAVPKKAKPVTAVDTVLAIIKNSKKGVNMAALMEKTGYNQKKIANLVFKLRKQGKIKSVDRGVYVKA